MMLFAALIAVFGARSQKLSDTDWSDRGHAALVVAITAAALVAYRPLGFLLTMTLLVFTLLVLVERRNVLVAAAYSIGVTAFAYWLFGKALKSPLERGVLWF
jgi:Tripartite tricarboxylate transporter TctB family